MSECQTSKHHSGHEGCEDNAKGDVGSVVFVSYVHGKGVCGFHGRRPVEDEDVHGAFETAGYEAKDQNAFVWDIGKRLVSKCKR